MLSALDMCDRLFLPSLPKVGKSRAKAATYLLQASQKDLLNDFTNFSSMISHALQSELISATSDAGEVPTKKKH